MKINREKVEKYLGKKVEITLLDNKIVIGELHKTGEEKYKWNNNLYFPRNYYFVEINSNYSYIFRVSHIKKIKNVIY